MDERKFIEKLRARAREQEQVIKTVPFPSVFAFIIKWFSFHPWRLLIPLAFLLSVVLRIVFGPQYSTFILAVFRLWL